MNRPRSIFLMSAAVAALMLQGCRDHAMPTDLSGRGVLATSVAPSAAADRHIVLFAAERVSADFTERVERLGGTGERALDSIGAGVVRGLSQAAVATLSGD